MIATLSLLADEIASLRHFGANSGDELIQALAAQMADGFTLALDVIAESPAALDGELPCWRQRANG